MCQSNYEPAPRSPHSKQVINVRPPTATYTFLPKEYSGDPYASVFTLYTAAEVLLVLEAGWGIGNVEDLRLSFLHGPEDGQ